MPKLAKRRIDTGMIYMGIDPGKKGGITHIIRGVDATSLLFHQMPETELDIWNLMQEVAVDNYPIVACIEDVHSMPKQGVASVFTFGKGYGGLRMALTALGASWTAVSPQKWQKHFGLLSGKGVDKKTHKNKLRAYAQRLFPHLVLWSSGKGVQEAVCDSLLIAHYCRLIHEGS